MEYQSIYFLLLVIVVLRTILLIPVDEFGTINRLTPQLREQNFSGPDFQVCVTLTLIRNNPDRGKPGGKKCLQTRDMSP